jgi:hypothetical protein
MMEKMKGGNEIPADLKTIISFYNIADEKGRLASTEIPPSISPISRTPSFIVPKNCGRKLKRPASDHWLCS